MAMTESENITRRLTCLLDTDPAAAVEAARQLDISCSSTKQRINRMSLRAAILVDGGRACGDRGAVGEAVKLLRELHTMKSSAGVTYNLANALNAMAGDPPKDASWFEFMNRTRDLRFECRSLLAAVATEADATDELRTQAWTNLAYQLSLTWRLGEAHDSRLRALQLDPTNGVAAGSAAQELLWLEGSGLCAPTTRIEAAYLAKIARHNEARIKQLAVGPVAKLLSKLVDGVDEPPDRAAHSNPFLKWVEKERLTLAPTVELVEPELGHIDWLMLPGVLERTQSAPAVPPPVYAMFNVLKADFIVARDLAWRAMTQDWPSTARYADTLDYANYGVEMSALVLAHRSALDLLDKVAVLANHYFELGKAPKKVYFRTLWGKMKPNDSLRPEVETAIQYGAVALLGLVELAADYDTGWRQPQRTLRNAGTHRFVVLHDEGGEKNAREAPEVERHACSQFESEVTNALRVSRSAIQVLAFAIRQYEYALRRDIEGPVGSLHVPDHDWIRGSD